MPRENSSQSIQLNSFISKFGNTIFCADDRILFCKVYRLEIII